MMLGGSKAGIREGAGSSSSKIRRKNLEAHLCPLWNFSSQLKQRPFSLREAISSGERRFHAGGGVRGGNGGGNKGGREVGDIERGGGCVGDERGRRGGEG